MPRSPISRHSSGKRSAGSADGSPTAPATFVWRPGETAVAGRAVTLALRHGEIGVWLSDDRLEFGLADGASLRERALDWMRRQALEFFRERVAELARPHGLRGLVVGLSNAQTAGELGSTGASLNWRLMMLPRI